jgi:transglutaminase-like putative cysteine protease
MEKKRPQLNPDELLQLRWLLGGVAALLALWSAAFLDLEAIGLLAGITVAVVLALWKPALPACVPAWLHRLAFPVIAALGVFDLYDQGEVMPAMTRLALLLLAYRAISYRKRRDDLQLVVLGLFLVVVTGVLTVSMGFAFHIMAFTGLSLAMLMAMTLSESSTVQTAESPGRVPAWAERVEWMKLFGKMRALADWRVMVLGGFLFAGVAVASGLLFLAIPRFELRNGLFMDGLMKRKSSSGFTDTLRFGDVADIVRDEGVAMRVEVSDRSRLPAELYWRMVVMDEYRDQAFRLSTALKSAAFDRPRTVQQLRGEEPPSRYGLTCTFYLEPGVGRYLPFTGGFESVNFTERQDLRMSSSLRLVELTRDPMSMKAYRVRGMTGRDRLRDPQFAKEWRKSQEAGRVQVPGRPLMHEVNLGEADLATLAAVVAEITGGVDLPSTEFAAKAQAWLGARHEYSLSMELPKGTGDPLVRWIVSKQPGHCELFAGAFTLLARTAGHPARVVGGFLGGTWNEDYLIVRNSNAHAWCELFDEQGTWVRVDPTRAARGQDDRDPLQAMGGGAALLDEVAGWAARMDRLRLFWYRRIVNFDQNDQRVLAGSLKDGARSAGKNLKEIGQQWLAEVRTWLAQPWSGGRVVWIAGGAMGLALAWWGWRRKGRAWWLSWRSGRTRGIDPVRREAGRWLRRLSERESTDPTTADVKEQLARVRYGPRERWPATAPLWRQARRLSRGRNR